MDVGGVDGGCRVGREDGTWDLLARGNGKASILKNRVRRTSEKREGRSLQEGIPREVDFEKAKGGMRSSLFSFGLIL